MSLAFQWLQELKEKKRAQAKAALGVRKSPGSHSIKVFYGESTALEEEKKEASRPKLCSPPKKPKMKSPLKKLCHTVSLETVLGLKPKFFTNLVSRLLWLFIIKSRCPLYSVDFIDARLHHFSFEQANVTM